MLDKGGDIAIDSTAAHSTTVIINSLLTEFN